MKSWHFSNHPVILNSKKNNPLTMLKCLSQHYRKEISFNNQRLMTNLAFIPLCNCLNIFTNVCRYPIFLSIGESVSRLTIKAFDKSTKTWYRGISCSIQFCIYLAKNITSVVPPSDLKPLCDSRMTAGEMFQSNPFSKERTLLTESSVNFSPLPLYKNTKALLLSG